MATLSRTSLAAYVKANAASKYGLDPSAVLAVTSQEGAGGGIGDAGTSFGPWQLHVGGAFPTTINGKPTSDWSLAQKQAWAWSTAGVNYALAGMSSVASGLTGDAAVSAIVTGFERPYNPAAEIAGAEAAYGSSFGANLTAGSGSSGAPPRPGVNAGGSSFWGTLEHDAGIGVQVAADVENPIAALIGAGEQSIGDWKNFWKALVWLVNPVTWLRAVEVTIGMGLLLAGVFIVAGGRVPSPTAALSELEG